MANTYLTRTPSSTGSQTKFTISFWWKNNSRQNSDKCFFSSGLNSSNYFTIETTGAEYIRILNIDNASAVINYKPSRVFRDANAWYHIVIAIDTTQAGGNRVKFYTNGVRETAFDLNVEPNQNANVLYVNDTGVHNIGRRSVTAGNYMDGSLSHYHFIDGTAYDASAFGEYDANGVWTINTSPSVTYGTNGFFILKDGNSVTDQSGNSNNWTVGGGTLTKTEDNPSNVFATFNPLDVNKGTVTTFSNGNTTVMHNAGNNGATTAARSTLAYSAGKFYWETKCIATGGDVRTGIISMSSSNYVNNTNPYSNNECYTYKQNGYKGSSGNTDVSYAATYTAGDIIGIAHDVSAGTLIFYKNGVSQGTAFTGLSTSLFWGAFSSEYNQGKYSYNFGNGYFGTTAVASAGTNASGNGIFEYDCPTGYTALSTKGLNL